MAGNWNRADTDVAFEDFSDIIAIETPPTRGDEVLDVVFSNLSRSIVETEVCPPLVLNAGQPRAE